MPLHWPMSNLNVFCPSIEAKFYRVQQGFLCTYLPFLLTVFASNGWFGFTLLNCLFQFKPLKFKSLQILLRWSREKEKKKKKGISIGIFQSTINSKRSRFQLAFSLSFSFHRRSNRSSQIGKSLTQPLQCFIEPLKPHPWLVVTVGKSWNWRIEEK